jgi:TonB-linked SusC/RagA family outer membrane protein
LITTKKGKAGQARITVNAQQGWGQITRQMPMLNTPEYLEMRREGIANDGSTVAPSDYDINGFWDTTRYTNWQKALLGVTSHYMNYNANISGGSANTSYFIGGTFHRQTAVFPGSYSDQKGAVNFNVSSASVNQRFKIQLSGNYMIDDNHLPANDFTSDAINTPPDGPDLYSPDGSINWQTNSSGASTWTNPLSILSNLYHNKTTNLISNAVASYQVLTGLELRCSLGYTDLQTSDIATFALASINPEFRQYVTRSALYGNYNNNSWIVEPQITYKQIFGFGKFDFLLGSTINQLNSNSTQFGGAGYNSDQDLTNIQFATNVSVTNNTVIAYKYNALFGRINYSLSNRYILDLNARRDGTSRFGPANQFHDFESGGLAWIFSEEGFVKRNLRVVSFGKLRMSYGSTGNDQIGDYTYLSLFNPTYAPIPYQGIRTIAPINLSNPYLQWEDTKKWEGALDLGLLKDRILFNGNYYIDRSSNQLLAYALPYVTGFNSIASNFPATVQNNGWEFTLTSSNVKTKSFSWSTHINLTIPRNKLVTFPNLATSAYASLLIIGKPINIVHLFHLVGVNDTTGIYEFASKTGPTYNPTYGVDNNIIISTAPKYYGGFQNGFSYKTFELDVLFQFVKQMGQNYALGNLANQPGAYGVNQPVYVLNRWQFPGDVKPVERFSASGNNLFIQSLDASQSDGVYGDASFIRLKNLSLSWNVPRHWIYKSGLQNVRFFMQGQNLLTITKYKGLDPENQSTLSLPPLLVLTTGASVEF